MIFWGGKGPILHLAHANSFHPGTYIELIEMLKQHFSVYSILFRPFHKQSKPDHLHNWDVLRDDLIRSFDEMKWKNVIGVGHSLGSTVTMMAAIQRPDLFSKLVIIEPPCVNPMFFPILNITPYFLAKHLVPPSRVALKRRHKWTSKEEAYDLFRRKRVFKHWSDETLRAYVKHGLSPDDHGTYRLTYSKYWESKIYCTIENPYKLFKDISHESLCIRGEKSDVINGKNWGKWKQLQSDATFENVKDAGHHVPLERPKHVALRILNFTR